MADIIDTANWEGGDGFATYQIYNGLDCCVTHEIYGTLTQQKDEHSRLIYNFSRALQAPVLEMMLRGIRVDTFELNMLKPKFEKAKTRAEYVLNKLTTSFVGYEINPRSDAQLKKFFYETLGIPEIWSFAKGEKKLKMDRETLEKLSMYLIARPFVNCILTIRELDKKLSVLNSKMSEDGRMRFNISVAGTETGRFSSSKSAFGEGTNAQNITDELRIIFIPSREKKFCYVDLEQAESRGVAYISGDEKYIHACTSGDLHTTVCKMVWSNLPWTGDPKKDKDIAETPFYRHFTYRDMAKRGGHGSNYHGKPFTMARHLKVAKRIMEDFQEKYFAAFPGIPEYHREVSRRLQIDGYLITPVGRKRYFFDRASDDTTLRKAIAFLPQSLIADVLNLGLWRVWHYMKRDVDLLLQLHDAILFEYDSWKEDKIVPQVMELMTFPVPINGREMIIPCEAKVGWNWSEKARQKKLVSAGWMLAENPDSMIKYKGHDDRVRVNVPEDGLLQRRMW